MSAIQDSGGLDFLKALVASGANVNAPTKVWKHIIGCMG